MDRENNQDLITPILQRGKEKYGQHLTFLQALKSTTRKEVVKKQVLQAHNQAFEQIDCLECGNCCKTTPPIVTNKDSKRIAAHLGMPPKTFKRKYLIEDLDGTTVFNISPCRFLSEDNICTIYEIRPEACRRYPHTDEEAFIHRPKLNAENTLICPAATLVVEEIYRTMSHEVL